MEENASKFSSILKEYVSDRRKTNPKISESRIAHNLGISNTTFYRMLNYRSYPSVRNLLKLCKSVPKLKTLVTEEILAVTRGSRTGKYMESELETLLSRKSRFIAYVLALSAHGVTEEELLYCIGHEGKQALKTLIEKGFIEETRGRYKATEVDKGIVFSFEALKRHLKILVDRYKPDNASNNYIYYQTESLNRKGLKRLHEIYKETHKKVQKLMEQEENKGDMPIFAAGFYDMFFIRTLENKRREEK